MNIEKWTDYLPPVMGVMLILLIVYLVLLERGFFDR